MNFLQQIDNNADKIRKELRRKAAQVPEFSLPVNTLEDVARRAIVQCGGNKSAAAQILGISRAKIRRLTGERM